MATVVRSTFRYSALLSSFAILTGCTTTCTGPVTVLPPVIAFQSDRSGNNQIYTIHSDGSSLARVTNDASDDVQPMVSGAGLKIGYVSAPQAAGHYDLWTVLGNGTQPMRLTQNMNVRGGHWSSNGADIVFSGTLDSAAGGSPNIFLIRNDGTNLRQLTANSGSNVEPCVSHDAKHIVFTSTRTGHSEIYVMNYDGTGQTRLTNAGAATAEATYSPDDRQIAFWSDRDGTGEIYLMNSDGSNVTHITNGPGFDFEPAFSPSTREVVFSSQRDVKNFQIYIVNVDSKVVRRLTDDSAIDRAPDWR